MKSPNEEETLGENPMMCEFVVYGLCVCEREIGEEKMRAFEREEKLLHRARG